jgi:hypothetical protein
MKKTKTPALPAAALKYFAAMGAKGGAIGGKVKGKQKRRPEEHYVRMQEARAAQRAAVKAAKVKK